MAHWQLPCEVKLALPEQDGRSRLHWVWLAQITHGPFISSNSNMKIDDSGKLHPGSFFHNIGVSRGVEPWGFLVAFSKRQEL